MDGKQVFADRAAGSGSDKTAIRITGYVVEAAPRRGKIGRCIDRLVGWSFILTWLVVGYAYDKRNLPDESEEDPGDRRGTY